MSAFDVQVDYLNGMTGLHEGVDHMEVADGVLYLKRDATYASRPLIVAAIPIVNMLAWKQVR